MVNINDMIPLTAQYTKTCISGQKQAVNQIFLQVDYSLVLLGAEKNNKTLDHCPGFVRACWL